MSDIVLDKEEAVFKHDSLRFAEETKPFVYRCDKSDTNGILLVTNIRMSFYYKDDSGEMKFLHYLFNMTDKLTFYPNSSSNIVELNSAYEVTVFVFRNKIDFIEFNNFIASKFPRLLEVSDIKKESPLKNKGFIKEEKQQEFQEIKPKFFHFDKEKFLEAFRSGFAIFLINLGTIIVIMYFASLFFPQLKPKFTEAFNYPYYWITKQRIEKDMFAIAHKMISKDEYPDNITEFILKSFSPERGNALTRDMWGNLYDVEYKGRTFKLISYGMDKKKNTKDDIVKEFAKINN